MPLATFGGVLSSHTPLCNAVNEGLSFGEDMGSESLFNALPTHCDMSSVPL